MKGYVWYSYGSDATGPKLAEGLKFESGKKTPRFDDFDTVVGWGCKPGEKYNPDALKELIERRRIRVLNHPDRVHENRNKLEALCKMQVNGVSVPGFTYRTAAQALLPAVLGALERGELDFPLIGFNKYHKGFPIFCFTLDDLQEALKRGDDLDYFRSFCPGTEYRIHVFRDTVLAAEMKILAADPVKACAEAMAGRLQKRAEKQKAKLQATSEEIGWVMEELAQDLLRGPNHLRRSTNYGWALQPIAPLTDVPDAVLDQAIRAVDVVGLDMGAVSVIFDNDNSGRVTGVISAPGLSEEQMALYVSSIKEFVEAEKPKPRKAAAKAAEEEAPKELVARLRRKLSGLNRRKAEKIRKVLEE